MGNFQQKMAEAPSLEDLAPTLKHLEETRPDSEIEITDKLTELLSDLNTKRISNHKSTSCQKLDWSDYTFVCIQGFPAVENEFQFLDLPGEIVYFSALMFSKQAEHDPEDEKVRKIEGSTFINESNRLKVLFDSIKKKHIVLVYHSAGNFMLSMYFYYHGYSLASKIRGMIDISGAPLRYYISARLLVPMIINTDFKEIMENGEKVHKFFMKSLSQTGFNMGFNSKYHTLAFIHYIKSPNYGEIFQATWHHPKVLKMLVHGRNDTLFDSKLLNEKVIYYTYRNTLEEGDYTNRLRKRYTEMYKPSSPVSNLQQRFIVTIPRGQHSVHHNEKNQEIIKKAVDQYLTLIHE